MVIIFCGVPGVGKSTIAKALEKKLKKLGNCKLFVSDKISGKVYTKIAKIVKENLNKVDFLLIDATLYKKKWRDMVYKLAKKERVLTVYLHCSLATCLKRNKKRKPSLPDRVIHIIHHEMEKPIHPNISINTDKIKPKEAVEKIFHKTHLFPKGDKLVKKDCKKPVPKTQKNRLKKGGSV